MGYIRQGDVLLVPTSKNKIKLCNKKGKAILAFGEATGHSHTIQECLYAQDENGLAKTIFLEVPMGLEHQEHDMKEVPVGVYDVIIQRRVNVLGEIKKVMD